VRIREREVRGYVWWRGYVSELVTVSKRLAEFLPDGKFLAFFPVLNQKNRKTKNRETIHFYFYMYTLMESG
jgi:hypothetical protein